MKTKLLVLPSLSLGGAALLFAPLERSEAFSKIGGSLGETQRDVRVHDNFLDSTANNNTTPDSQFPGYLGCELAIWKGIVEWGAKLHGDGTGDPLSNPLGDGGANFDAFWAGNASAIGTTNQNVVSSLSNCGGGGTLAFTETPISDGWRIRYCDEWTWDDGPGTIGARWDIQGVMCHEYGHALGLGHSTFAQSTMFPSGSAGQTSIRSIHSDDIGGVQCVYGVASLTKPMITATSADTGTNTLTIYGMNFGASGVEVWLTPAAVTAPSTDPIVRVTGLSSTGGGTVLSFSIPAAAGPGDVIVNNSGTGNATVSNAFPTDLMGTFGVPPGPHPDITSITPSSIDALIPGISQTITIAGNDLDLTTSVTLDGSPIDSFRWTILDPNTITLDMPQAPSLGAHNIGVTDGVVPDQFGVTVVANTSPTLEWGNGEPMNNVSRAAGLDMILAGPVGALHVVRSSPHGPPSFGGYFFDALNRLISPPPQVIPASGWVALHIGHLPAPALGADWYGRSFLIQLPQPFVASNDQSILLVP